MHKAMQTSTKHHGYTMDYVCEKSTATTGINEDLINEENNASAKADELDVAGGLMGLLVDTLLDQFDMGFGILMDRDRHLRPAAGNRRYIYPILKMKLLISGTISFSRFV